MKELEPQRPYVFDIANEGEAATTRRRGREHTSAEL
jgi:hypothetical protein